LPGAKDHSNSNSTIDSCTTSPSTAGGLLTPTAPLPPISEEGASGPNPVAPGINVQVYQGSPTSTRSEGSHLSRRGPSIFIQNYPTVSVYLSNKL